MSVVAFDKLGEFRARANSMLDANRAAYREILGTHPRLEQQIFDQGTTVFPRLVDGDGDRFASLLQEKFETSVVPGRFFGRPEYIRIGLGGDIAATRAGFARIAEALG
jgi:aspartate/methionine/tyrosine aminotransferase